jgi:hypothetical protein
MRVRVVWLLRYEPLIHAAGAGTTRVAAASAWAAGRSRSAGFFASNGETGQLLAQSLALTLGAGGFLLAHHDSFKLVFAFLADVFKNRHFVHSVKIVTAFIIIGELE